MGINRFNVRVYGLVEKDGKVLVTDEVRGGTPMTKFVGGGLEFGEGMIDGLQREFMEETGLSITVLHHFYTTDFFQASAFNPNQQVISIYYTVELHQPEKLPIVAAPFEGIKGDGQCFRWVTMNDLSSSDFTFPIDRKVADQISANFAR